MILKTYEDELLKMKFDSILHLLGEIGKTEIFTNLSYFEKIEKISDPNVIEKEEPTKEFKIIQTISNQIQDVHIPNLILSLIEADYEIFEKKAAKFLSGK